MGWGRGTEGNMYTGEGRAQGRPNILTQRTVLFAYALRGSALSVGVRERNKGGAPFAKRMCSSGCVSCIFPCPPEHGTSFSHTAGDFGCFRSIFYQSSRPFRNPQFARKRPSSFKDHLPGCDRGMSWGGGRVRMKLLLVTRLSSSRHRCRRTCSQLPCNRGHSGVTLKL